MLTSYGASAMDVLTALMALSGWPVPAHGDHIIRAPRTEVVQFLLDNIIFDDDRDAPNRVAATLNPAYEHHGWASQRCVAAVARTQ